MVVVGMYPPPPWVGGGGYRASAWAGATGVPPWWYTGSGG